MRASLCFGLFALFASNALAACSNSSDHANEELDGGVLPVTDTGGTDSGAIDTNFPSGDTSGKICFYSIEPANAVVKIDTATAPATPGTVAYKALKNCEGDITDVTAGTTFSLDDPSLGSFAGNTFTSTSSLPADVLGKTSIVRSTPGNGLANVTVIAQKVTGANRDFFFEEPYRKPPTPLNDVLKFGTNIKQVDVAFLQDTSASMGEEIANLKAAISDTASGLIAQLKTAIPSVGIAVAHHEDFPVNPYGFPGSTTETADKPFELFTETTTNVAKAQSAVGLLALNKGGQLPESQYEAMYQLLTGEGLSWTTTACPTTGTAPVGCGPAGSIPLHTPKAGTYGGADFRAGSLPVLVEITDSSWFEKDVYVTGTAGKLTPHAKSDVVSAFNDRVKAKFVGVHSRIPNAGGTFETACTDFRNASCDSSQGYQQAIDLAVATNSLVDPSAIPCTPAAPGKCCTGAGGTPIDPISGKCPLVFTSKPDGTGVSDGIVKAIQAISVGSAFDVTAIPRNDPANPDGVDAPAAFIANIRAMDEGYPAEGCPRHEAKDTNGDGVKDTFVGVTVGTPVCFEINVKQNETVEPKAQVQFFRAFIDVVGLPGSIRLDSRDARFLVPPKDPPRAA
jgi:hypothetical protein